MPEFTTSFFEYHRPILTEDEQKAINEQLKSLYHGKESILYSKESQCFEESREQLLALLDYYISIAPNLTLLESYKTNIQRLSKDSDFIDLYITFNVAKKKLEQFLLFFKEKYKTFDTAKFNSYVVTACYQGAYSNLIQALGISTLSDLTDLKQAYLMDLATHYLRKGHIKYQSGMEPHYAMGLVNHIAQGYGVEMVEDPSIPPFKEIELEGFTRYVKKHFNVAGFIQLVSQCPELQLPHNIVDSAESNYKDKYNQITIFFKWLGEKTEPLHELQRLYHQESDEQNYTYYRLIPKQGFRLSIESLLARYLEKAGHLKGVSIKIDKGSLVDNGETLVRLTDEGYQTLSQEDIIALLNEAENNKELPLGYLLKQLNTETLFERYSTLDSSPNEAIYVQALLKQPTLPQAIAKKIYASIPQEDTLKHKQQLTKYLLTHPCADFSVELFESLFENVSLTEEEQLHYFQFAIENNLATQVHFFLKTYPNVLNNDPFFFLFLAITYSSLGIIEILLEKSALPVNAVDSDGDTLLHIAVKKGDVDIVEKVLQWGTGPNQVDNDGWAPLHFASRGNENVVEKLIQGKADPNLATKDELTPLSIAVLEGHVKVIEKLIQGKADPNLGDHQGWASLHVAAAQKEKIDVNVLKTLITLGAKINQRDKRGFTPLAIATQCNVDVMKTLLELGANTSLANDEGWAPLHFIAYAGFLNLIKKFKDSGADLEQKTESTGKTPLHIAADNNRVSLIKEFKDCGADFNPVDKREFTPLRMATDNGDEETVKILLQGGADPNLADQLGYTPIHVAAEKGLNLIEEFNKYEAKLNQKTGSETTPLQLAAVKGHVNVITTLLQLGADSNLANCWYGWTALHFATIKGHANAVQALIAGGANPNQVDKRGKTPADIATEKGHFEILETLHKGGGKFNLQLQTLLEKLSKNEKETFIMQLAVKLPKFVQNKDDFLLIINALPESEKAEFATKMLESLVARQEYKTASSIVKLFPSQDTEPTPLFKDKARPLSEQYLTQLNQDIPSPEKGWGFFKYPTSSDANDFKKRAQKARVVPSDSEILPQYKNI